MASQHKVITDRCIISYPNLLEPQAAPGGGDAKYGAALVFPEGTDVAALKKAAFQVVIDKFGEKKAKEMLKSGQFRLQGGPHHTIRNDKPEYGEGAVFVNARTGTKPGVVDANLNVLSDEQVGSLVYAGAVVKASVVPYWYDVSGNKGVAWGLNNVQYLGEPGSAVDPRGSEGERLDNRSNATDEFDVDEDAVGDLSDLVEDADPEAEVDEDISELLK